VEALARELLAEQACFRVKDLAVNGCDLIALGIPEGPAVGRTLNALLEAVLGEEVPNERDALLALARSVDR
jgi:tRNA nucleotidyltransferase (CCA-adding enzyme)